MENFCDIYHVFKVHPALHEMQATHDRFAMEPDGSHIFNSYAMAAPGRGLTVDPDGPTLPDVPGLPEELHTQSPFLNIFPNTTMAIFPSNLELVSFEPVGPTHCIMHMWFYFVGKAARAAEHREAREKVYQEWESPDV